MTARDDVELRMPPNSAEAEQSVLGGLLLDNDAFDRIGDLLEPRDFYGSDHRAIFETVVELIEALSQEGANSGKQALDRVLKSAIPDAVAHDAMVCKVIYGEAPYEGEAP